MKRCINLICCVLAFFLLSGFDSGIEAEKLKDLQAKPKPSAPVFEYEEPVISQESNQDLYCQYHLLVVTALDESSSTVAENPAWSYSMAQNASNYIKLIVKLINVEHKQEFVSRNNDLNTLMSDMRKRNITAVKRKKLAEQLKMLAEDFEDNFFFDRIHSWIKN